MSEWNQNSLSGMPNSFAGMPVFREGDNVFLVNFKADANKYKDIMSSAERLCLQFDEYRCPFDFLKEHKQWFEWHKRLHFDKQKTGRIITDMVDDIDSIKAHRIEKPVFSMFDRYGSVMHNPRSVIKNFSI